MGESQSQREGPLRGRDIAEIVIGSQLLAFPVAVTEEVWNLSEELSLARVGLFTLASLVVVGVFVYTAYNHEGVVPKGKDFYLRVSATYVVTLVACAALLMGIDRLKLVTDPTLALKRTVLVAFPGSFSATVVDSIR
ncbi:MAG: DUF2391 family protein [Gemmatimonadota bacterium]|nr:MAG: DUF2391 family protein [Gemmatimonadota bacterium]